MQGYRYSQLFPIFSDPDRTVVSTALPIGVTIHVEEVVLGVSCHENGEIETIPVTIHPNHVIRVYRDRN